MNSILRLITLFCVLYFANAQWRGDIGYRRQGRNWELQGGASYNFNRGRTRAHVGGHGFINSNGQRGYGVNAGIKRTFGNGRGSYGISGYKNSNGQYGYQAHFTYRFGKRRGRRSISEDTQLMTICKECITIETITSPEKLEQYADINKVQFSMIARFKRFHQNEKETILSFKVKQIIAQTPPDFNISEAKVFIIFADKSSCALICLKDFVHEDYIVTGAMFHGRLIIHNKILLFHEVDEQKPAEDTLKPQNEDEAQEQEDNEDEEDEDDVEKNKDETAEGDSDGAAAKDDDSDLKEKEESHGDASSEEDVDEDNDTKKEDEQE